MTDSIKIKSMKTSLVLRKGINFKDNLLRGNLVAILPRVKKNITTRKFKMFSKCN